MESGAFQPQVLVLAGGGQSVVPGHMASIRSCARRCPSWLAAAALGAVGPFIQPPDRDTIPKSPTFDTTPLGMDLI